MTNHLKSAHICTQNQLCTPKRLSRSGRHPSISHFAVNEWVGYQNHTSTHSDVLALTHTPQVR